MIALLQRVINAEVSVAGRRVGAIGAGLLVFVGIERGDDTAMASRLLHRVLGYRVFADVDGRMNRSLAQTGGGLLLVPQFTLAADTRKGMRAGFSTAAAPEAGARLFSAVVTEAAECHGEVATGEFGAHMEVALVNDGPVTFHLRVRTRE